MLGQNASVYIGNVYRRIDPLLYSPDPIPNVFTKFLWFSQPSAYDQQDINVPSTPMPHSSAPVKLRPSSVPARRIYPASITAGTSKAKAFGYSDIFPSRIAHALQAKIMRTIHTKKG